MESFTGKLAVVTGGGTGMGRELTRQLAAEGCDVAICDVSATNMADTVATCATESPDVTVTSCVADVSNEADLVAFREHVVSAHATDHIDLLFNNAGIGGGGSIVNDPRDEWEQVFNVCWGGVYLGVRTFLPLLLRSTEARIVNTSSVNGFWATLGPTTSHTAYSAAKFAVKGFSEALLEDFRINAPHVGVSVVMPGHIGTEIVNNSRKLFERLEGGAGETNVDLMRQGLERRGIPTDALDDDALRSLMEGFGDMFRDSAPMSAAEAATVILDGVKAGTWRILVGDDARQLDEAVRADPLAAYGPDGLNLSSITGT